LTTLGTFADRVPADARALFDQGLSYLQGDRVADAGGMFKAAIRPGAAGSAAMAYLGACLAATGHDAEAAQLWRAAMADAGDLPSLHQWLGDALMRTEAFGEARVVFEAAVRQWPSDVRFARPLGLLYAMSGRAGDAVRSMEQVIAADPGDADALYLTLEWLFRLGRGGVLVHSAAEDLQRARAYADSYANANGANQPLVQQWLSYLEQPRTPLK
jgi:tetratricopeptide (TPR) repeat protein